ncbi:MAG TPA: metallopeptidase TldD-related protein, partial [Polyangiaceae bacterium]
MKAAKALRLPALWSLLGALCLTAGAARADLVTDEGAVKRALSDELARSMQKLALPGEPAPYFVGYVLVDREVLHVNATYGAALLDNYAHVRHVAVTVRVGSHELEGANTGSFFGAWNVGPIDDDYVALRHELWRATDDAYKSSLEELSYKSNMMKTRMARRTEEFPDFSREAPHETVRALQALDLEGGRDGLKRLAAEVSLALGSVEGLKTAVVGATVERARRRLLTSEQTWADEGRRVTELVLLASTQAEDGMPIERRLSLTGHEPTSLPPLETLRETARAFGERLVRAREAPLAENGTAVILFEGQAAAQLIQALLVPGLDGSPPPRFAQADVDRSFASKLGFQMTAPLLDVYDDPTLAKGPAGEALWGSYAADDEGVPARRVSIV